MVPTRQHLLLLLGALRHQLSRCPSMSFANEELGFALVFLH
jgi:hypothetical protein